MMAFNILNLLNAGGGQLALETQKLRDQIKTDFCINNNIKLIRIKYNEKRDKKSE